MYLENDRCVCFHVEGSNTAGPQTPLLRNRVYAIPYFLCDCVLLSGWQMIILTFKLKMSLHYSRITNMYVSKYQRLERDLIFLDQNILFQTSQNLNYGQRVLKDLN